MITFKQIIQGTSWILLSQIVSQIASFISTVFLARLLLPEDFGLIAMTYIVSNLAYIFAGLGLGTAIIQRKEINLRYLSTAFWATFITGVLISVTIALISPAVAFFFKEQKLTKIIAYSGLAFIFGGCSAVHRDFLKREMKFKIISLIDLSSSFFSSCLAVFLAFLGFGVWSLVVRNLAYEALKVPLFWIYSDWKPVFSFDKNCFKDLFGFSSYALGAKFVNYFNRNTDNIIIGRFLGATPLGFYDLAYSIMLKPLQHISYAIGNALYPALSKIQDDKRLTKETYLKTIKLISFITFPMMAGLFLVAAETIEVIYGKKWMPTVPILRILCIVGALQSIGTTVGAVYLSQGKSRLMFKMTLIISPFIWAAFIVGIKWGIVGVAACYAIVSASWWLISHAVANRLIDLDLVTFLKTFKNPVLYTLIMIMVVIFSKWVVKNALPHERMGLTLIFSVFSGVLTYFLTLVKANDTDVVSMRQFIVRKMGLYKVNI